MEECPKKYCYKYQITDFFRDHKSPSTCAGELEAVLLGVCMDPDVELLDHMIEYVEGCTHLETVQYNVEHDTTLTDSGSETTSELFGLKCYIDWEDEYDNKKLRID